MIKRLQLFVAAFAILAFSPLLASASDPSPLQDFCVAINDTKIGDPCGLEGTLYVSFVTSNTDNCLITKVLNHGDVFVFPVDLIHFKFNIGNTKAVAFAGLSSQNPGVIMIANAVFGSNPPINPDVLTKAFQLDKNIVTYLQSKFWWDNN
ncbi:hypothetical protein E1A91_A11G266300v1 [Gossypium mustelinum]|uniref:Germin-like protein n=1 Tax=Gossypium mustelinum TaxID=34275 RepID=A0A5D2XB44_GOSMU|nr:hypothetical protein E1A91_A11G266300v1 [Gossypium mustelinum]